MKKLMSKILNTVAREPDIIIGGNYLLRWYVIPRNKYFNIYLHRFERSDDDRALHDHPWFSVSILLSGCYMEHFKYVSKLRKAGNVFWRSADTAHRIELVNGPVWTIFITGRKVREWGFYCPQGWRHWKEFTNYYAIGDSTSIGPGCGE